MMTRLAVLLGFQLAWFATAFSVTAKRPLLGVLMSAAVCAAHLALRSLRPQLAVLVIASAALGYVADTTLVLSGVMRFDVGGGSAGTPFWMVLLWSNFALSVDAMPASITRRTAMTAIAGAIGGPLSYLAGERFDALTLTSPRSVSVAAVAVEWAIAMPLLVMLEHHLVSKLRAQRAALVSAEESLGLDGASR